MEPNLCRTSAECNGETSILNSYEKHSGLKANDIETHLFREFRAMVFSKVIFSYFQGKLYGRKKLTQNGYLCMRVQVKGHEALDPKRIIVPAYLKSG